MKSTARWQVAHPENREQLSSSGGQCVVSLHSPGFAVTVDELSSISVSVSAVKVGQFKRHSWVHLNALKSCGGLQIARIEDRKIIVLGDLFFLFGQSASAAYFRKQFFMVVLWDSAVPNSFQVKFWKSFFWNSPCWSRTCIDVSENVGPCLASDSESWWQWHYTENWLGFAVCLCFLFYPREQPNCCPLKKTT